MIRPTGHVFDLSPGVMDGWYCQSSRETLVLALISFQNSMHFHFLYLGSVLCMISNLRFLYQEQSAHISAIRQRRFVLYEYMSTRYCTEGMGP